MAYKAEKLKATYNSELIARNAFSFAYCERRAGWALINMNTGGGGGGGGECS